MYIHLTCGVPSAAPLPGDASFEGRPPEARSFYNELRVTAEEKVVVRKLNEELSFVENWELAIVSTCFLPEFRLNC